MTQSITCRPSPRRYTFDGLLLTLSVLIANSAWFLFQYDGGKWDNKIVGALLGLAALLVLPYAAHRFALNFLLFARTEGVYLEYRLLSMEYAWALWPMRGRKSLEDIESILLLPTNYEPIPDRPETPTPLTQYLIDRFVLRPLTDYWIMDIGFKDGPTLRMAMMNGQEELLKLLERRFPERIEDLGNLGD